MVNQFHVDNLPLNNLSILIYDEVLLLRYFNPKFYLIFLFLVVSAHFFFGDYLYACVYFNLGF